MGDILKANHAGNVIPVLPATESNQEAVPDADEGTEVIRIFISKM